MRKTTGDGGNCSLDNALHGKHDDLSLGPQHSRKQMDLLLCASNSQCRGSGTVLIGQPLQPIG